MPSVLFPSPGDLIQFQKGLYTHWAVLVRNKYIIHVQAPNDGNKAGNTIITKEKLDDYLEQHLFSVPLWINVYHFAEVNKVGGCWASVNNSFDKIKMPLNIDEIIDRAESMVGTTWKYDLFSKNCEHFAHWCRYDVEVSGQSPNCTEYVDKNDNYYICGQVGGTNVGFVDFKLLGIKACEESAPGRKGTRAFGELASVGVANLARASVGAGGELASYNDKDGIGYKAELKWVDAEVGPVNGSFGLSASSGIDTKNGFKAEFLGTGIDANSNGLAVKVLGTSVGIKYPWKWF